MSIKIHNDEDGLVLTEVHSGVLLRTAEGNAVSVCMRDDTVELNIIPKGSGEPNWWRVNMQRGTVERMGEEPPLRGNWGRFDDFRA